MVPLKEKGIKVWYSKTQIHSAPLNSLGVFEHKPNYAVNEVAVGFFGPSLQGFGPGKLLPSSVFGVCDPKNALG